MHAVAFLLVTFAADTSDLTIRDLMEKLETKKVAFKWKDHKTNQAIMKFPTANGTYPNPDPNTWEYLLRGGDTGFIVVSKMPTEKEAKDAAGSTKTGQSWGVFVFQGDADCIKKILAALK